MNGTKKMPWRHSDRNVACPDCPVTCSSMFVTVETPNSGRTTHCARSASAPMAMTSASSRRNSANAPGAARKPAAASTLISTVPTSIVK